jgi:hypothetical protein
MQFALLCSITNLTVAISNKTPLICKIVCKEWRTGALAEFLFLCWPSILNRNVCRHTVKFLSSNNKNFLLNMCVCVFLSVLGMNEDYSLSVCLVNKGQGFKVGEKVDHSP